MQAKGIIVDLCAVGQDRISADLAEHGLAHNFIFANAQDFETNFAQGEVAILLIFASDWNDDLSLLLATYTRLFGPISRFVAILCDKPTPQLLSGAYEFGIEHFLAFEGWPRRADGILRRASGLLTENAPECHCAKVHQAICFAGQGTLKILHDEIEPNMAYDYLAAYTIGRAREALGEFHGAVAAYQVCHSIYPNFRPALSGMIENLLIIGKTQEAWSYLKQMEGWFDLEAGRKALLVCAALSDGNRALAEEYLALATSLSSSHPRVIEAQVQVLLAKDDFKEVLQLLSKISNAGALFASRLNEVGIKLSKNKQSQSALALYEKTHEIVRPELKYKISLNAALAAHRAQDFQLARTYISQAESEYGGTFAKLEKIRSVIDRHMEGGRNEA